MTDLVRKIFFAFGFVAVLIALITEFSFGTGFSAGGGPGLGVRAVGMFDCLFFFVVLLIGLSMILPERIHGRLQGFATLIVSICMLIASFAYILLSIGILVLLLALISSPPFGWIIYLAAFRLDGSGATAHLALTMFLKIVFAVLLLLAQQRYLENKQLVLLILLSMVCNVIVNFLHGFLPSILLAITDTVAGIVVGVLTLIWALWSLVRSIPSIIKVLMVWRAA
jgi:hypothetical protein